MATGNLVNSPLKSSSLRPGLGFAALFIIAVTVLPNLMKPLFRPALAVTMATTNALGNLLGLTMTNSGDIITVNGFAMQIIDECTALNYVFILALAILLYTRHSIGYRIKGVAVATGIVITVNAIRLIVTGLAGTISLQVFHFVHEYVWVVIFALLVFGIWKVWADREFNCSREKAQHIALISFSCTATFLLVLMFENNYCHLLANLAAPIFRLLMGDPQATLVWNEMLIFSQGGETLKMGLFIEIANFSVYVGMMLPYLWYNRKATPFALLGLVVLVVLYAELVAFMGMNGINHGIETAKLYQFIGNNIFLAAPLALYLIATTNITKEENKEVVIQSGKRRSHC